ncbi:hypothetical protein AURDEDRAFT_174222 [Auricularia subglabra TFB-10046 SS5]|uniref:Uncharacterized protein n=1 Tax=Auricularia subglabra (strain TFB-10046 / SS5) TaxID=717982 RepID=J0CZ34_AURST|nr:hypothetical protein AURDEDRAFT_174222 [Auricularia subglabra TFB-10046 SS5]
MNSGTTVPAIPATQQLPVLCLQLLSLLVSLSTHGTLSTSDIQRFQQLWGDSVQLAQALPPPSPGRYTAGRDNYDRHYLIQAGLYRQDGICFERRFFPTMEKKGFFFSDGASNYFYYNPDGNFYASYGVVEVARTGDLKFTVEGVKLSQLGVTLYTYPPDIPARLRGGVAARYFA